jgi:hypothetical protein
MGPFGNGSGRFGEFIKCKDLCDDLFIDASFFTICLSFRSLSFLSTIVFGVFLGMQIRSDRNLRGAEFSMPNPVPTSEPSVANPGSCAFWPPGSGSGRNPGKVF